MSQKIALAFLILCLCEIGLGWKINLRRPVKFLSQRWKETLTNGMRHSIQRAS